MCFRGELSVFIYYFLLSIQKFRALRTLLRFFRAFIRDDFQIINPALLQCCATASFCRSEHTIMAEATEVQDTCSNPGCDQPGTKSCSACGSATYCGVNCQTADWPHHREECQGHLRKVGKATLEKALGFVRQQNLALIQSCLHNKEFDDAEHYARHAYFMIAEMTDNFIPSDQYPQFLADVSYWLAQAILKYAIVGGIPPGEKQKVGEEAIVHARKALELYTQLGKNESREFACLLGCDC